MDRYWEGSYGAVFDADDRPDDPRPPLSEWAGWSTDDMIRWFITDRTPEQ